MELRDALMLVGLGLNLSAVIFAAGIVYRLICDIREDVRDQRQHAKEVDARCEQRMPEMIEQRAAVTHLTQSVDSLRGVLTNGLTAQVNGLATTIEVMRATCLQRHAQGEEHH